VLRITSHACVPKRRTPVCRHESRYFIHKEVNGPLKLSIEMNIILICVIAFFGGVIGFLIRKRFSDATIGSAKEVAKRLIEEAEKRAEILKKEALLQAKEKFFQEKSEV
jgi:hypothetical protein